MDTRRTRLLRIGILLLSALLLAGPGRMVAGTRQEMTLDDAIRRSHERSYDAMVARLVFLSQYWSFRSFKAELLPEINLAGDLAQFNRSMVETRNFDDGRVSYVENNTLANNLSLSIDQRIAALGGTLSLQSYLYRLDQFSYDSKIYNSQPLYLSYRQPLRAFNELKWLKKTEPVRYEQAQRTYLESMEDVTLKAVELFFSVLSAQSAYQQSLTALGDRRALFETAKKRFELGTVEKSEILQLELSLLNAEVAANDNRLALEGERFDLFSYLRIADYEDIDLLPPTDVPELVLNIPAVCEKALANSSHVPGQRVDLLEAQKSVAQAKANKGLQMELNAELGFSRTANSFRDAYRKLQDSEIIGLTFSMPLFDWGVAKGKVKMAEADLEAVRTQLEQARETYLQDLRMSVLRFNSLSGQCRNALRAQEIADERYGITKRRFEAGNITVTDLNTAQQEYESARAQYINLLKTFWEEFYTLRKATLYDWVARRSLTADFESLVF